MFQKKVIPIFASLAFEKLPKSTLRSNTMDGNMDEVNLREILLQSTKPTDTHSPFVSPDYSGLALNKLNNSNVFVF